MQGLVYECRIALCHASNIGNDRASCTFRLVGYHVSYHRDLDSSESRISVGMDGVWPTPEIATKDPRVSRALELLQQGYAPGDAVAKSLNLSSSRLRHLFKRELGMSRRQYHQRQQLSRARKLLTNSFLSVKEIAHIVGINDVSHFCRNYKALYGETASQTRMRPAGSLLSATA
jgi:AraC-like DNA-binding protein